MPLFQNFAASIAKLEFEDVKADVLNVIPPQRAGDLARSAGLADGPAAEVERLLEEAATG